jgi:mono/diheme cytochrome c family protein
MRRPSAALAAPLALAAIVAGTFGGALAVMRPDPAPAPPTVATTVTRTTAQAPPRTTRTSAAHPAAATGPRAVFAETCASCHTLADARASGMFGPDLDAARPSAARVRTMIRTGSLDGIMQPGLLQGADARRVAAYVARVAGRR